MESIHKERENMLIIVHSAFEIFTNVCMLILYMYKWKWQSRMHVWKIHLFLSKILSVVSRNDVSFHSFSSLQLRSIRRKRWISWAHCECILQLQQLKLKLLALVVLVTKVNLLLFRSVFLFPRSMFLLRHRVSWDDTTKCHGRGSMKMCSDSAEWKWFFTTERTAHISWLCKKDIFLFVHIWDRMKRNGMDWLKKAFTCIHTWDFYYHSAIRNIFYKVIAFDSHFTCENLALLCQNEGLKIKFITLNEISTNGR
jgi:hypothetical protein